MTTTICVAPPLGAVKLSLLGKFEEELDHVLGLAEVGSSARELEKVVCERVTRLGASLLGTLMGLRCAAESVADMAARGVSPNDVSVRHDSNYTLNITSSLGPVTFPSYAYRERCDGKVVTRNPARDKLFPLYRRCRSSPLCLEWETRLAGHHPYRTAQAELAYYTRGATHLEDTTIQRHAVRVGHLIEQEWLYRSREDIVDILRHRATRDTETNKPILYWSSDAHALRRYVNESFTADWKMMNGVRLWCVDQATDSIIHIGGEFTTGDCNYIGERIQKLLASGIVPADGDFGDDLKASYVFISDGAPWLLSHLASLLPGAIVILDAYHLLEKIGEWARHHSNALPLTPKVWLKKTAQALFGPSAFKTRTPQRTRMGHRKHLKPPRRRTRRSTRRPRHAGRTLLRTLHKLAPSKPSAEHAAAVAYIDTNIDRLDYRRWRARGYQIGSGAMESLHRTASQNRLKRSGAKWLPETLEAMFRIRMLELVGRWDEGWSRPDLFIHDADRFVAPKYRTVTGPVAAKTYVAGPKL